MARRWTLPGTILLAMATGLPSHAEVPTSAGKQPQTDATAAKPARQPTPQWPKTVQDQQIKPTVATWTADEIAVARAQCNVALQGTTAVTIPAEPIREGDCGTPAPVELISIGSSPQVTFSPPAIVTCDMVAALDKWFKNDVQPAARSLLGGPVVRVEIMSSYSCRTAYNRKLSRLSEHGRANAVDIRNFLTDRGDATEVLTDWGLTERDIKARIAAAKAEAAKQEAARKEAERLAASKVTKPGEAPAPHSQQPTGELRGSIADGGAQTPSITLPQVLGTRREPQSLGLTPPSRLGGPKDGAKEQMPHIYTADPTKPKERFLRRVHAAACRTFGTILGPEANEAHRNHFHIDMAERKGASFCE